MATLNANRMLGHSLPPIPQSTVANHWGGGAKQFAAYGALNGFNKQVNKREIKSSPLSVWQSAMSVCETEFSIFLKTLIISNSEIL